MELVPPERLIDDVLRGLPRSGNEPARRSSTPPGRCCTRTWGALPSPMPRATRCSPPLGTWTSSTTSSTGSARPRGRGTLAALRAALPDAGDVMVVNNGAAALLLAVTVLAAGREVVWSRGELVEIGDGFRLPDLVACTGATLREVGTTNRTTRADYVAALGDRTGCVLKVHTSNFRMTGFTSSVPIGELTGLGPPLVVDVGSGLLAPDRLLPDEPDIGGALRAGADVVTASGDKLLGGPQAGLIAGRADLIAGFRRHPLARALRVDKLTLAALEATLSGPSATDRDGAACRSERVALARRGDRRPAGRRRRCRCRVTATVGGGSGPGVSLPGWAVSLPERYAAAIARRRPRGRSAARGRPMPSRSSLRPTGVRRRAG